MKALLVIAALFSATLCALPTTVILVRHAEKAATPADNPPLSCAGVARAKELALVLRDVRPRAIYVTQARRTQETAQPFATLAGVTPTVVSDAADLVRRILALPRGVTVVVVGHSNTVPEVISRLGGPAVTIAETEFDRLFILSGSDFLISKMQTNPLTSLRYGSSVACWSTGS